MRRGREQGSALIEFAASLILISALFTGSFQLGYSMYTYNLLVNAVRAGARYAALHPDSSESMLAVRNLVVYGDPTPSASAQPVVDDLGPANVQLVGDAKTVTVTIRGFTIGGPFTKVKMDGKPTVTFPRTGVGSQ